jgi:hypothetical protein
MDTGVEGSGCSASAEEVIANQVSSRHWTVVQVVSKEKNREGKNKIVGNGVMGEMRVPRCPMSGKMRIYLLIDMGKLSDYARAPPQPKNDDISSDFQAKWKDEIKEKENWAKRLLFYLGERTKVRKALCV